MEKEAQEITIEELIEKERANLDTSKLTKVTLETFVAWKRKKLKEKALAEKKEKSKKEKQGTVSGRDLFLKDPTMLARHVEEDDGEDFDLTREQEEDDGTKVICSDYLDPLETLRSKLFWVMIQIQHSGNLYDYRFMRSNLTSTGSWTMVWTRALLFNWRAQEGRK